MIAIIGFAFLAGLVTILAPCIWPILPIVLSSSVASKGRYRPLGITIGIMLSFGFFTLAISYLVKIFHFDPNSLRVVAVVVIGFLGLTMVVPALSRLVEGFISRLSGLFGHRFKQGSGFGAGFLTGLSLGIVWSPCAGPILAAIAALAATGKVTFAVVLVTAAYVLGVGIPLFIFAYGGQRVITRTRFLSAHLGRIQRGFGVVMILTAVAIFTSYDKLIETRLLNAFPQFSTALNGFEGANAVTRELNQLKGVTPVNYEDPTPSDLFNADKKAPDFAGVTKWINTDGPISIDNLRGKVVLVDFWTYTCINCIRTLPHVTAWYDKYKDNGFVVIGVHTPEFQFEHNADNVLDAIKRYRIHYPVAQDNDYSTWNNYNNEYWPAEYLIDANGVVRRTHFGEGEYEQMETAIQDLLRQTGQSVSSPLASIPDQTPAGAQSPETYLGAYRMEYYYPSGSLKMGQRGFTLAANPDRNSFSLGGGWNIRNQDAVSGKNAELNYHFYADKVFLVLRPGAAGTGAKVRVFVDGKPTNGFNAGSDVKDGVVHVDSARLYNLVDLMGKPGSHIVRLEFETPGTEAFAFTFG
jgi:cytochrome c biogenesis protein CcdA/thiol-disulfide isomerase/thioredoxin